MCPLVFILFAENVRARLAHIEIGTTTDFADIAGMVATTDSATTVPDFVTPAAVSGRLGSCTNEILSDPDSLALRTNEGVSAPCFENCPPSSSSPSSRSFELVFRIGNDIKMDTFWLDTLVANICDSADVPNRQDFLQE